MLKKLTEEQQMQILNSAMDAFGQNGLERTGISQIAKASGVSVGVIYKYYADKEALFRACLECSLDTLGRLIHESFDERKGFFDNVETLIRACQSFSKEHPSYLRLYHGITSRSGETALYYAKEIETISAEFYTDYVARSRDTGEIRTDLDPAFASFFLDNLLMMLHFTYGCDYYRERLRIYCGDAEDRDEKIVQQLMLFLKHGVA